VLHRLGHGGLGDGVEGDALDLFRQRPALGQQFADMPADRLALAVRVGSQDQAVGGLGRVGDRLHLALLVAVQLPIHRERFVRLHRAVLDRQVADVAVGGEHGEAGPEILLDGLGLGRRFDDHELHAECRCSLLYAHRVYVRARVTGRLGRRQARAANAARARP
jgi:hypothetical protein